MHPSVTRLLHPEHQPFDEIAQEYIRNIEVVGFLFSRPDFEMSMLPHLQNDHNPMSSFNHLITNRIFQRDGAIKMRLGPDNQAEIDKWDRRAADINDENASNNFLAVHIHHPDPARRLSNPWDVESLTIAPRLKFVGHRDAQSCESLMTDLDCVRSIFVFDTDNYEEALAGSLAALFRHREADGEAPEPMIPPVIVFLTYEMARRFCQDWVHDVIPSRLAGMSFHPPWTKAWTDYDRSGSRFAGRPPHHASDETQTDNYDWCTNREYVLEALEERAQYLRPYTSSGSQCEPAGADVKESDYDLVVRRV